MLFEPSKGCVGVNLPGSLIKELLDLEEELVVERGVETRVVSDVLGPVMMDGDLEEDLRKKESILRATVVVVVVVLA